MTHLLDNQYRIIDLSGKVPDGATSASYPDLRATSITSTLRPPSRPLLDWPRLATVVARVTMAFTRICLSRITSPENSRYRTNIGK